MFRHDFSDHEVHLVPHGLPGLSPFTAKKLDDAELSHLAPERAVVSESHVSAVVGEVADGDGGGAVGEDAVLGLEDLLGDVRRRNGHHVEKTHPHVEEPAVLFCQLGKSTVGELVHHGHVSDQRQARWPRWKWKFATETG
ncbi:unnamed protein product [Camellia sinensis]